MESVFTSIYHQNAWKGKDSRSGPSSNLQRTQEIREKLPLLFDEFNIKSIVDAPCGDFYWMRNVIIPREIKYIGVDIVKPMIDKLNEEFLDFQSINFLCLNLTSSIAPFADLMISRDFLFHLSYSDTLDFLVNFINSNIPYLLTTSHLREDIVNKDIKTGGWRWMNLHHAPYNFPRENIWKCNDGGGDRELILYGRKAIVNAFASMKSEISRSK